MKLEDLAEDCTPQDFMLLERESLERVPYTLLKWGCQAKGCTGGTTVRDYGIAPFYFLNRNSKKSTVYPWLYWQNVGERFWLCGKHWKFYDRLVPRFGQNRVMARLLDTVPALDKLTPKEVKQ
jgi:hypothetical protein